MGGTHSGRLWHTRGRQQLAPAPPAHCASLRRLVDCGSASSPEISSPCPCTPHSDQHHKLINTPAGDSATVCSPVKHANVGKARSPDQHHRARLADHCGISCPTAHLHDCYKITEIRQLSNPVGSQCFYETAHVQAQQAAAAAGPCAYF